MADYISRQAAVIEMMDNNVDHAQGTDGREVIQILEAIPAADVVPVVHGNWLPTNDENKKRCNKCDTVVLIAMYPNGNANFCPNCGAKMDGGKS